MKILLDTSVWGGALNQLQAAGHDVVWAGQWDRDPGDREIIEAAFHEQRILVTLDKDFGELAVLQGLQHAGIVRLVGIPARSQAEVLLRLIQANQADLAAAAMITVEPGRLRVRQSPHKGM